MADSRKSRDQTIEELQGRIEGLEVRLKHVTNDLEVTRQEYEDALNDYLEMYTNLESQAEELKRSKKILEQKGQELKTMLDSSPALIYYKYKNLRYMRVNKVFEETLGLPGKEIIGKTYSELFPDRVHYGLEADLQVIEKKQPLSGRTEPLETGNGMRQLIVDRIPYTDFKGEVIGIIGFALDVTELKEAEEENRALEGELVQAQKMESIGVLAGGIAHDFNNMLGVIMGYAQLAYEELDDGHPVKTDLSEVIKSTQKATGVARTLLDYARPGEFKFAPANMYDHVSFVAKQLRKEPDFNRETMNLKVKGDQEVMAKVDVGKIEQCLFNMGKNAIHALRDVPEGEIVYDVRAVLLEKAFCKTRLGLSTGPYVRISVVDNGSGISPQHRKKIFDPFFTTRQTGEGTGLGLAQVYSIVQEHQGYIDVKSEPGRGTEFHLYLEQSDPEEENREQVQVHSDYSAQHEEMVLVIDNTDQMREMIYRILARYGYRIEGVRSGEEGIEAFAELQPNLVVVDHKLPGMSGKETIQALRSREPEARILLTTGYGFSPEDLKDIGADLFVSKPFQPVLLAKTVRETLDMRNEHL